MACEKSGVLIGRLCLALMRARSINSLSGIVVTTLVTGNARRAQN
jgi:hypothetical protein